MSDYLPPVVVELEGRHDKLLASLTAAKADVRKTMDAIGRMKATANVQLKLDRLEVQKVQRQIGRIRAQVTAKVDADTTKLDAKIQQAKGVKGEVKVKLAIADGEIAKIQRQIGRIKATVTIRARVDQAEETRAEQRIDRLTRDRDVLIRPRVVGGSGGGGRDGGVDWLGTLISLAPALTPIAASLGSIALSAGAAGVAFGALGAAALPQLKTFSDLGTAQAKVTAAVQKYGATSKQAATAQDAVSASLNNMPKATRQAAGAFLVLKSDFMGWSNGLARFTMKPVTDGLGVVDALLPRLSPLVQTASTQLDRLVRLAGGAISTPGFDRLMSRFTAFTSGVIQKAVDGVVHFARVISQGNGDGPVHRFLAYAQQVGPQVKDTLVNLSRAVGNILKASSEAGPGILSLVNAAAKLVAALPPSFISTAMQVYTAIKLISLTRTGLGGTTTAISGLVTRLSALRTVAQNAGGGLAGLRAAFASLNAAGKASIIIGGLAALAAVVAKLSNLGRSAPPDIDKLTTSLGQLGLTGKTTGEGLRVFGDNFSKLRDSIKAVVDPSTLDNVQQFIIKLTSFWTTDSTPVKTAKDGIKSIDQGLANLVKNGNADTAAAALNRLKAAYSQGGKHDVSKFTDQLKEYKSALDDSKFAQDLAADSMGLFGQQAQAAQKKLAAQKASADGLRQSIQALNDVNRSALDGEIGFQAAIDNASKAYKDNGKALSWKNGQLQVGTEKARNEAQALSDLAAKTDANTAAARDAGKSWATVNGIYQEGRAKLIAVAQQMGLTKTQAKALADQILKTPDKTALLKADERDLKAKLADAVNALNKARSSKTIAIKGNNAQLLQAVIDAQNAVNGIHGKSVVITYKGVYQGVKNPNGTYTSSTGFTYANGGIHRAANGLQTRNRQAMIAPGGSWILWAEDETEDESYIPLAPSKRKRSRKIAEQTVARLGGVVAWKMARGGIIRAANGWHSGSGPGAGKPKRPTLEQLVPHLSSGNRAFASGVGDYANVSAGSRTQMVKDSKALVVDVGTALINGVKGTTAQMMAAIKALQGQAAKVLQTNMLAIINRDNDKLKSLSKTRARLVKELDDAEQKANDRHASRASRKAAAKRADELRNQIGGVDKQTKAIRAEIAHAQTVERTGSAIAKVIAADNAKLSALAKQRDGIAGKLKDAQGKLAGLQKSWADKKSQVSEGIMGGLTAVTAGNADGRPLNAADVLKSYEAQAKKAQQFSALLVQLKSKGLNSATLDQLAAAGVDGGYDSALALAGGSAGQIKQINSLQSQTKAAADKAGGAVADSMYGAGIKAAQGLVKGLQDQQKAIEAQMLAVAESMQKAIKKALGIKSPSRVFAEIGDFTGKGLALGVAGSTRHAVKAAQDMASQVQAAARGVISTGPLALGGHAGAVVHHHTHVHLTVEGSVVTEKKLIAAVQQGIYRDGMRNSSTYPAPRRG